MTSLSNLGKKQFPCIFVPDEKTRYVSHENISNAYLTSHSLLLKRKDNKPCELAFYMCNNN